MSYLWFSITQIWSKRKALAKILDDKNLQINNIHNLDPKQLLDQGIEVLVLDFDGVLAPHGENEPNAQGTEWLSKALRVFPPNRIFILSNRHDPARSATLAQKFPGLGLIQARKKPDLEGLIKIKDLTNVSFDKMLIIDDRLWTGVLLAIIANSKILWVIKPEQDYRNNFFIEGWFQILRYLERGTTKILNIIIPPRF